MQLSGHKVLITGGTRGIGAALAETFLANGNAVILVGRSAPTTPLAGATYLTYNLDQEADRAELIATLRRDHKDLSVLVNNAGIQHEGRFGDNWHYADYAREVEVNIGAVLHLCDGLIPLLRDKPEAAIVNVSSALAIQPKTSSPIYCATKAFIRSFTTSLRFQLSATSIKLFELVPPLVDTEMTKDNKGPKITPADLAAAFWAGWRSNQAVILAGQAKALHIINRLSPSLAARIVRGD
jgi:uncharacterized oxidoreductase